MRETYTEEEYREAAELWRKENPTAEIIPQRAKITISSGKEVTIGSRMNNMRKNPERLSEEEQEYWSQFGLLMEKFQKYKEEEYRQAAQIWKKGNPNVVMIPRSTVVTLGNGKKINLGNRLNNMRQNIGTLTKEEQEYWSQYGLFANIMTTEKEYREAAEIWKNENPGLVKIPKKTKIIISNGKEISLGIRMDTMRRYPERLSKEELEYWSKYGLFAERKKQNSYSEKEYREAAEIWKKENPNLDRIPRRTKIIISSGKEITLGERIYTMRKDIEKLTDEQKRFWTSYGLFPEKEQTHNKGKNTSDPIKKYTELFDGDVVKAERVVNCLSSLRKKRNSKKKDEWNIDSILKEFDVDVHTLQKCLERTRTNEVINRSEILKYEGKTLRDYCISNGYNYDVVVRAIKLHDMCVHDSLEQLINRSITMYNRKGQKEPATWIYEKYGNLVKHILLHLKLDSSSILQDMTNYTMTLEEAVRHDVFKRNKNRKENAWLEELYDYLIEEIDQDKDTEVIMQDLLDRFTILVKEYKLTQEEREVLINCFEKYVKTMHEYQRIDVGLETNQERKIEKIKRYNLDEYDIEESFFIPLEFDKGVLLGRQSELYKRRQLLRQYIIDWDYYTDIEKEAIGRQNNFTEEEIAYIKRTRSEINETIEESLKKM